jgi:predicted PurR-regulated permease PerM
MTPKEATDDVATVDSALEIAIHIGLAILLTIACLVILWPFIPLLAWGIIIAVAAYPTFKKLQRAVGGRPVVAAVVFTLALLAVLIIPTVLLAGSLVDGIQSVTAHIRAGAPMVPPPPAAVSGWPLIGGPLNSLWAQASRDLSALIHDYAPQIKSVVPQVLSASAVLGGTIFQLLLSIVVAGVLLANAQAAYEMTRSLMNRLFGEKGPEFQELVGTTIRSVTFGILGVAVIQAIFASIGFLVAKLPGAGVWAVVFLVAAILQVGMLVLIPAVIFVFATATTTKAVIFLIWCAIVGLMDNVLKPILLGRGSTVPIVVVFLGSIGGFIAMGIIGLFVGAIVLSVGYKLFLAWLEGTPGEQTAA